MSITLLCFVCGDLLNRIKHFSVGERMNFFLYDLYILIHEPNIPGPYAILLFTASDLTSITSHIHSWIFWIWTFALGAGTGSRMGTWSSICPMGVALIAVLPVRDSSQKWARKHVDNRPVHSGAGHVAIGVFRGPRGPTYRQGWTVVPEMVVSLLFQKLWFFLNPLWTLSLV